MANAQRLVVEETDESLIEAACAEHQALDAAIAAAESNRLCSEVEFGGELISLSAAKQQKLRCRQKIQSALKDSLIATAYAKKRNW